MTDMNASAGTIFTATAKSDFLMETLSAKGSNISLKTLEQMEKASVDTALRISFFEFIYNRFFKVDQSSWWNANVRKIMKTAKFF